MVVGGHIIGPWRVFLSPLCLGALLLLASLPAQAARDDVLVIVNDNSNDSPLVGAYYAQRRDIDPANIVHVRVPAGYFISWDDFRRLRDQLIHFMQRNTLDDANLTPVTCTDGDPPYYCQAAMDQLRAHTRIRYLVMTRGVPSRMTVDGSTLYSPGAPASLDAYLKYWLLNYFAVDVGLRFTEREEAFGDGRGMRTVMPATDKELIVGRIDGLNLATAKALVDRALAVEAEGLYGTWYGSTRFYNWKNAETSGAIYPPTGSSTLGWHYALGLFGEDRAECIDYLDVSGALPAGKAPAHCRIQFNEDGPLMVPSANYPPPGNAASRLPHPINALGYQGYLDGQKSAGNFNALMNWRKNAQCSVTLCAAASDPVACRAASTDPFREINTDCVGVAKGFMGYNHQSFPVSYLTIWPTGYFQTTNVRSDGWTNRGGGDVNHLAFPEVRSDIGFDDNFSLTFRNTDQVADPRCYGASDFSAAPAQTCVDTRRVVLSQAITVPSRTLDANNPPTYRVRLRYRALNMTKVTSLRARLFVHETGGAAQQIDYGVKTLVTLSAGDTAWTEVEAQFQLDPALHSAGSYDGFKLMFDTAGTFDGELGLDVISLQQVGEGVELAINGSFTEGHRQVATGDHAATFLGRLEGVAFWGSASHHQSGGYAFYLAPLETLIYLLRGLPLGDAVWFNESNNSGMLYGDPLYSPVAVRLSPVNATDTLSGIVNLHGSTINGRDAAQVTTTYRVDYCAGDDFFVCDQAPSAWESAGISGQGGFADGPLGAWDTTQLAPGSYTLRLRVTSTHTASARSQMLNDFYTVVVQAAPDGGVDAGSINDLQSTPDAAADAGLPDGATPIDGGPASRDTTRAPGDAAEPPSDTTTPSGDAAEPTPDTTIAPGDALAGEGPSTLVGSGGCDCRASGAPPSAETLGVGWMLALLALLWRRAPSRSRSGGTSSRRSGSSSTYPSNRRRRRSGARP